MDHGDDKMLQSYMDETLIIGDVKKDICFRF